MTNKEVLKDYVKANVTAALLEDIGSGDITAQLIPEEALAQATVISRDAAVICGIDWVNAVFQQVNPLVDINWLAKDGDKVIPNQKLMELSGPARALLTGERCALNFLQTLSSTATVSRYYADLVEGTNVRLLDTRKTIPGLRYGQKYAVTCGGCFNHRVGLFDAFLIKENHIAACGSIEQAIHKAKHIAPDKTVEIEVESLSELEQALASKADIIMLDNFSLKELRTAVEVTSGRAKLEASGGITDQSLRSIAETGVDFISIGALTKDCKAIDLSMRFNSI